MTLGCEQVRAIARRALHLRGQICHKNQQVGGSESPLPDATRDPCVGIARVRENGLSRDRASMPSKAPAAVMGFKPESNRFARFGFH